MKWDCFHSAFPPMVSLLKGSITVVCFLFNFLKLNFTLNNYLYVNSICLRSENWKWWRVLRGKTMGLSFFVKWWPSCQLAWMSKSSCLSIISCFACLVTSGGHFYIIRKWRPSSIFVFCPFSPKKNWHKLRKVYWIWQVATVRLIKHNVGALRELSCQM